MRREFWPFHSIRRTVLPLLLVAAILTLLWSNLQSLYTFPAPNSWIYWAGDETQYLAETESQMATGLYAYPNAVGSSFQEGSGVFKGSTWITSAIYGTLALVIDANPVDVGRSVTFAFACLLLFAVFVVLILNRVEGAIALTAVLLLASTPAFSIMSHSARPDILVAFTELLLIAFFASYRSKPSASATTGLWIGLLIVLGILVSGHVWIDCALPLAFLLWKRGFFRQRKVVAMAVATIVLGFISLSLVYIARSGKFDIFGPFDHVVIPLYHFFSPGAQRGNLVYRLFIIREWSPFYITTAILLALGYLVFRGKGFPTQPAVGVWLGATALLAFSIVYFESIVPRYYIYLLPVLTVTMGLAAQRVWNVIPKSSYRLAYATACLLVATVSVGTFIRDVRSQTQFANRIAVSNSEAISESQKAIARDPSLSKRVIVSTPALYGFMASHSFASIVPLFLTAPAKPLRTGARPPWPVADYVVTYNSSRVADVIDNDRTYATAYLGHWRKIFERAGVLTDIGRSYTQDGFSGDDTLRVYRIER